MDPCSQRIYDFSEKVERRSVDILVIGGGVAGFSAALAVPEGQSVLIVTKEAAGTSSTARAQGGVAAVLGQQDSFESHRDDTLRVGAGLCDPEAVECVVSEGPERIHELINWGGHFDRDASGGLHLALEGGHSEKRVVHAHGDRTGLEVQATLIARLEAAPHVELLEHSFALDLLKDAQGKVAGAALQCASGPLVVEAGATILATGGGGQLYRETTNPDIATGDGFAMALRAGAVLRDMEFVQFHPTTLYIAGSARHLITEAVRGEGAYLRDMRRERFMVNYHPRAELAPRDVVSRSIILHMAASGDGHVFLDLTHLDPDLVSRRFPQLIETCAPYNLDVTTDLIPVHPSAHYFMGGVDTDNDGVTSVPGLFACGEVARTGLHGANRLASNSLLEGLVFGRRAGLTAAQAESAAPAILNPGQFTLEGSVMNIPDMRNSIQSVLWRDVGIVRNAEGLARASELLNSWSDYVCQCRFRDSAGWELINILTTACAITDSALARQESRGAHFRTDFPDMQADGNPELNGYQCGEVIRV